MAFRTRLTNSFRDLPVMDKVPLSRNLSSELMPHSAPIDEKFRFNSVMFSCTLPVWSDDRKNARRQKERERKKSLSKGKDRYTIVKGLAGGPDGISFESATKKKHFLRVRDNILIVEAYDDAEEYRKESTFIPLQDMWFGGYVVFESLVEPAHYIRRCAEHLMLQKYENSPFFKEDASFKLARKRCIACVKIGTRVWAKIEKGCFLRGVVVAVDEMVHIQLENGNKVTHKKMPPSESDSDCNYVPDIIPHPLEIDVGTRVLARWFNRLDSYYPATITAVRRTFFNVKYDDGDKGTNNINEIRLLKRPEVEGGGTQIPSWSSLDGLPRVGGLCIDSSGDQSTSEEASDGHETGPDQWTPSRDIHERPESPSDHENDEKDAHFGYENNLQYLSPPPNIQPLQHAPVVRNVSQVSGGSTDSGYHENTCAGSTRQRRTGLWAELHSQPQQFGFDSRFLSPFSYNSHVHVPGLSDRNLSELSVTSSVDSGYQGGCSRHEPRPYSRDSRIPSPARPTPADKNPEKETWDHEDTDALSDIETSNSTNYSTPHELDFPDSFTSGHASSFSAYNAEDHAISHASHTEGHRRPHPSTPKIPYRSNSSPNGPYITKNGTCVDVAKCAAASRTCFAEADEEDEKASVAKPFPSRTCPIHHHGAARERSHSSPDEKRHGKSGCDAVLNRESPSFIGLETVI